MTATDFEYDGLLLSSICFMVCQFDEGSGFQSSSAGSALTMTTVSQNNGKRKYIVNSIYEEVFSPTISICKPDGSTVTTDEYEFIMHWLNRPDFHRLTIMTPEWQRINFNCTCSSIEKVEFRGRIVGFNLQFQADSAFGWGDQISEEFVISSANGSYEINDQSDEIGFIYPDSLEIQCSSVGDLTIKNSAEENRATTIKQCSNGETITINGRTLEITSSTGRNVYDYFNFNYPRIVNSVLDTINTFSFSIPCTCKITYTPVRKVVF